MFNVCRLQRSAILNGINPVRHLRVTTRREYNYEFEKDRKQWKEDIKVVRKEHKQEYWNL